MTVQVQCYAGRKADERPVRFQLGDHEHAVIEVLDQWYDPEATFFKVRTDDGIFIFCDTLTQQVNGCWSLSGGSTRWPS